MQGNACSPKRSLKRMSLKQDLTNINCLLYMSRFGLWLRGAAKVPLLINGHVEFIPSSVFNSWLNAVFIFWCLHGNDHS